MPAASYARVAKSTHCCHGTTAATRTASAMVFLCLYGSDDVVFDADERGDPGQVVEGELLQRHALGVVALHLLVLDVAGGVDALDAGLRRRDADLVAGLAGL